MTLHDVEPSDRFPLRYRLFIKALKHVLLLYLIRYCVECSRPPVHIQLHALAQSSLRCLLYCIGTTLFTKLYVRNPIRSSAAFLHAFMIPPHPPRQSTTSSSATYHPRRQLLIPPKSTRNSPSPPLRPTLALMSQRNKQPQHKRNAAPDRCHSEGGGVALRSKAAYIDELEDVIIPRRRGLTVVCVV